MHNGTKGTRSNRSFVGAGTFRLAPPLWFYRDGIGTSISGRARHEEPGILERIRRGQSVEHYETVRRRKDGGLIDVSLTVSPIKNDQGQVVGASKIARDISERKRTEESLHQAQAQLAHRADHPQLPTLFCGNENSYSFSYQLYFSRIGRNHYFS